MKKAFIKYKNIIYSLAAAALIFFAWLIAAALTGREIILPSPGAVFDSLFKLFALPSFYGQVINTLLRTLISFAIALFTALILASLSALYKPLYRFLSPIILLLRSTPTISIILLALIWLKTQIAPMFIAFLIIFPALYAAAYGAIINVDSSLVEMSKVYKVSDKDMLLKLYIPSILPALFFSVKGNISLNLKIIIASEVLAQTQHSMGMGMQISKIYLDTPALMAWTVIAIVLSWLLEALTEVIRKSVIRWKA
jgi:NitT/TauT family transport system permease protein